jgi:hypothetical protein
MEANAQINTYLSAKWNVEICRSGESGIESSFPFGKEMKSNRILDLWLESMVELMSPGNAKTSSIGGGLVFSRLTDGTMQLGTGTKPISDKDTALHRFYKQTNYIRPNFNRATGTYISGSGMAIFSRTYDFPIESERVTYTEAGFKPNASDLSNNAGRRGIWSRFLFTSEELATGFLSGYIDNSGNFNLHNHPIDIGSGIIVSGQLYNIPPVKTKEYQIVYGYRSGNLDQFNNFTFYNQNDPQFKHAYLSGYVINGQQIPFANRKVISQPITGYISGFRDTTGNFSGFESNLLYSSSGYYLNNQRYQFPPIQEIRTERIIGYISGFQSGTIFSGFSEIDKLSSGYFFEGSQRAFPTGQSFSGFSGQLGFSNETGFIYSGFFQFSSGFSGIEFTNSGTGIYTGFIGSRNFFYKSGEFIGFAGENPNEFDAYLGFAYSGFPYITGSGFSGVDNTSSGTGILTGILGYRNLYENIPLSGFSGLPEFDSYLGFQFSGLNFPSYTVKTINGNTGPGYASGIIGNRNVLRSFGTEEQGFDNIPSFEYGWRYNPSGRMFNLQYGSGFIYNTVLERERIVGFRSGVTNAFGTFIPFTVPIPGSQGFSGYILSGKKYYFPTGNTFSGFSGMPGFYTGLGFSFSGFFPSQSGFSGESWPKINYEKINGFISGFRNDLGQFFTFQDLYPELPQLRSSGYFLNNQQYYFPTGNTFSGFNGMPGFSIDTGFAYTGFNFPEGSTFSGLTGAFGTGILSGFIGHRVFYTYPTNSITGSLTGFIGSRNDYFIRSNSGIMTGIFGFRKQLSGIELTTGEFVKVRYDTAIRIPAMITPIPVTGENVVYGDFNGSGSIKLIGNYSRIFGTITPNGIASAVGSQAGPMYGFWWPAHNKWFFGNQINPNIYLSAVMIGNEPESGLGFYPNYPPPFPPENDTRFMFVIPGGDEVTEIGIQGKYPNNTDYYGKRYRINLANTPFPSWPTYEYGGLTTDYPSNSYPKEINYWFQFKAEFPNNDTGIGGFFFAPMEKWNANRLWHPTKPFVFEDYFAYYLEGINIPYVGWYYRFDNYQTKFEDQLISLNITLAMNRETYV